MIWVCVYVKVLCPGLDKKGSSYVPILICLYFLSVETVWGISSVSQFWIPHHDESYIFMIMSQKKSFLKLLWLVTFSLFKLIDSLCLCLSFSLSVGYYVCVCTVLAWVWVDVHLTVHSGIGTWSGCQVFPFLSSVLLVWGSPWLKQKLCHFR